MNPILQFSIFVVLGTVILTAGMMGIFLLIIRMQRDWPDTDASPSSDLVEALAPQKRPKPVVFQVGDKQVKILIDVADAPVVGLHS